MATLADVRFQMRLLGYSGLLLKRGEVRELPQLLRSDELINAAIYGSYSGGFGMLVATNQRLLFVDRHFMQRHITDIPYENINSVQLDIGILTATITIYASTGTVALSGMAIRRARRFFNYVDQRIEQPHMQSLNGSSIPSR